MREKNDIVNERLRASLLFDYYGELLNESQRKLCSEYLMDDLSLSEIADASGISRQGVHDKVRRSIKQMEAYEKNLALIHKSKQMEEAITKVRQILFKMSDQTMKSEIEAQLVVMDRLL